MISILMPKLGLTMTEGTIQQWLKAPGDSVAAGEAVAEIETDKSTASVEAPAAGTLWKIECPESGTEVEVGMPIAYLLEEGEKAPEELPSAPAPAPVETPAAAAAEAGPVIREPVAADGRVKASPAARKLAEARGIDLAAVAPDAHGVIHLAQVNAAQAQPAPKATPLAKAMAQDLGVNLGEIPVSPPERIYAAQVAAAAGVPAAVAPAEEAPAALESGDQEIPFRGIRKTVARRMSQSKREVPHFYLTLRADMTRAKELMARQSTKVSVHDLLIRVLAKALMDHPTVNAHVYEDRVILKREINVGVAVATDGGLIVPVVRNVLGMSLTEIAQQSGQLIQKARAGALTPDEYQGGTFTVSNLGMFGIEEFTAIVNQPEAAILAVGRTVDTPVVENGEIVVRPLLALTASFDHRAVDGAEGARFLQQVKQLLEDPQRLI